MEERNYPIEVKEGGSLRPLAQAPEVVLQEAQRAASALQRVVAGKKKPVIFRGEQYLEFEDWQTVAKFYGFCARTLEAEPVEIFGVKGAKARAEVVDLRTGQVIGGAEAYCMRDEENWQGKPWFQLASMAQTRAGAKALRNVLAWVVVLAGYRPTPAEEIQEENTPAQVKARVITSQGNGSAGSSPSGHESPGYSGQGLKGASPSEPAQGSSAVQSAPEEKTEHPTREEIQNLLRLALRNGFVTLDKDGKKCLDYHHLGQFLKASGFPSMIKEMNREQCLKAALFLESRAKSLFLKGE